MKNTYLNSLFAAGLIAGVAALSLAPELEIKDGDGSVNMTEVKELVSEIKTGYEKNLSETRELAEKALSEAESGVKSSTEFKDKLDEALTKMNESNAAFKELEQKLSRVQSEEKVFLTAGEKFINAKQFKDLAGKSFTKGDKIAVEMKTITSLSTDADGSAGDLVRTQRVQSPMMEQARRRMTVRDLLAPGQTNSNAIEYVQETGFTNNAGMVAEGTRKPESSLKYDLLTASVRKQAHFIKASSEIMADAPGLASMIDGRLRYGLEFKEELQLLNGDGTGQNLLGLRTGATAFNKAFLVNGETNIDVIRLALLQASLAEYPATGTIIHPTNWADIETTKDADGNYIIGNPQGTLSPTLWSLPVIATQAMGLNNFLTGAFSMAAQIFDRMDATVMVSTEDGTNFIDNLVTVLAEQRLALAIYRPEAFISGSLTAPTPVA